MFKTNKILNRLNTMLDRAINNEDIELIFDENKASQIESKLHKYLSGLKIREKNITIQKSHVDELISDISHQTKTPLANIMLYSELLSECNNKDELKKYNSLLQLQTEKLDFLISTLVKTARLENGIISVAPVKQPISLLLLNIKSLYPDINTSDSDVSLSYDLKWTTEAVVNIIDNAIKYGSTNTNISVTSYELFTRIDISDNGIGIAEEEVPKIFARFYRSPRVNNKEGLGIGLYISREIITKQGGYIKVKSKPDNGSIFSIFLPK